MNYLSLAGLALFVFVFVALPTQSLAPALAKSPVPYWVLLVASFLLAVVPLRYRLSLSASDRKPYRYLEHGLLAIVALRVLWSIDSPFNYEEYEQIYHFSISNHHLPLFNHMIARVTSNASMALFGINKIAARLPAFVFAALFLFTLFWFRRLASPFARVLVLANLAVNACLIWHMHSIRGYVSMLFVCALSFAIVWESTRPEPVKHAREKRWLLGACLVLSCFTHFFAIVFNIVLFATLVVWTWRERVRSPLLPVYLVGVPIALVGVIWQASKLVEQGAVGGAFSFRAVQDALSIFNTLGFYRLAWAKLAFVAFAAVLISRRTTRLDFLSLFCALSLGLLALALVVLRVPTLESRFVVAFALPFLVWFGNTVDAFPYRRAAVGFAVALFVIVPLAETRKVRRANLNNMDVYERFVNRTMAVVKDTNVNCYTCEGNRQFCNWFRALYLPRKATEFRRVYTCGQRYRLHFHDAVDARELSSPPLVEHRDRAFWFYVLASE